MPCIMVLVCLTFNAVIAAFSISIHAHWGKQRGVRTLQTNIKMKGIISYNALQYLSVKQTSQCPLQQTTTRATYFCGHF